LIDHLEHLKFQFEQAVKIANFTEIGRVKELMKRVDQDLAVCVCMRMRVWMGMGIQIEIFPEI
jgi:hypothetical protein